MKAISDSLKRCKLISSSQLFINKRIDEIVWFCIIGIWKEEDSVADLGLILYGIHKKGIFSEESCWRKPVSGFLDI